ncbi:HepT-like ribonuclease domain-containing protein [Chroococcidiopsis sp. CCMEE 29]|uniref:HepT-like ribonuclease domain-containing protein n=1 Tax=Chroococcidiopsis sp. CCMEE 29 TaxID=155894 RepID=UPI002020BCCA|nr:HepT-like ribonuclease domain-containing protein [Chroococcidiopsis sp. CCMEE 29]
MSKIDNLSRLLHMRDAAIEAINFAFGRRRDELNTNRMLTLALVKDIEIVGEAASRISAEYRAKYPQLSWTQIIGIRNRLTHAYFEVNLDIVWQVVTNDLPTLVIELEQIISLEA